MKNKFKCSFEKVCKKPINGKSARLTFGSINDVHKWANSLIGILEYKPDLALLHHAINNQQHVYGAGYVPLKTERVFGADTVVILDFKPNQYKVQFGFMTPEMAQVFNQ